MIEGFNYSYLEENRHLELDGEYPVDDLCTMDVDIKYEDRKRTEEQSVQLNQSIGLTNNKAIRSIWINIDDKGRKITFDGKSRLFEYKKRGIKTINCNVWKGLTTIQMMLGNYQENIRRQTTYTTMVDTGKQLQKEGFTIDEIVKQLISPNKEMDYLMDALNIKTEVLEANKEHNDGKLNAKAVSYIAQVQKIGASTIEQIAISNVFKQNTEINGEREAEKQMTETIREIKKTINNPKIERGEKYIIECAEIADNKNESSHCLPENSENKMPTIKDIIGDEMVERLILLGAEKPYRYTETDKIEGETKILMDHAVRVVYINTLDHGTIEWAKTYGENKGITVIDKECDWCYCISQLEPSNERTIIYVNGNGFVTYRPELIKLLKSKYPNSKLITLVNLNGRTAMDKRTEAVSVYGVNDIENLEQLKELLKQRIENAVFYDTKDGQCMMVLGDD